MKFVPAPKYSKEDLIACGNGDLFGPGNGRLPADEMLMFDSIVQIDETSGKYPKGRIVANFNIHESQWFFKVHWKNDPNMPGMLQIESLVQMSALSILTLDGNKGKTMYLVNANNLRFFKKILKSLDKYVLPSTVR